MWTPRKGSAFRESGEEKPSVQQIATEVGSMAAELQSLRRRAAAQEVTLQEETEKRKAAEANARDLTKHLKRTQKSLEDTKLEARSSAHVAEQSLMELLEVTERLTVAEEITDVTTTVANSFCSRCETATRELEQKNVDLQQQRFLIERLEQQLAVLEDESKEMETVQEQLRQKIQDLEAQIEMAIDTTFTGKDCDFRKLLHHVTPQNGVLHEKLFIRDDNEIATLKQEVEKQQAAAQELEEENTKLELCLREAQKQLQKLRKTLQREQAKQVLASQIRLPESASAAAPRPNSWSNFKLPGLFSISAIVIVFVIKR